MAVAGNIAQRFSARRASILWSAILILSAFAGGSPAQGEDGFLNWIVKSVSTDEEGAVIRAAMSTPQVGAVLMQGQRVSAGPDQQMVLTNGRDLVTLKAGSSVEIGDNDSTTDEANIELRSGTVHVEAGKRTPGHTFSVEAPYLVATVKGTQFDVSTSSEASAVSVTEGVVGVEATNTRQSVDVTPGKTAIVGRLTTDIPQLIDSPVDGAASAVGIESTETASSGIDDGTGISGVSDLDGSESGSGSGSASSGGGSSGSSDSTSGSSDGIGGAVGDATGAVGGAVSDTTDAVGGAVSDTTGAIGDTVGGDLGGAVSDVGDAVGGAVSGVGGALGGALGGLGRK